jgi:hypothetical protein
MNPALIFPSLSVYMASDGSTGESVRPVHHQCKTCPMMIRCTTTNDSARQRLLREGRIRAAEPTTGRPIERGAAKTAAPSSGVFGHRSFTIFIS